MRKYLILISITFLTACANLSADMTNPNTKATATCKISGFGILGALSAQSRLETCIENAKQKGFVQVEGKGN